MKKSALSLAAFVLISASNLTVSAQVSQAGSNAVSGTNPRPQAVSGTNPRPQAVSGTNPRPQAVSGTNPRPQGVFAGLYTAFLSLFGF